MAESYGAATAYRGYCHGGHALRAEKMRLLSRHKAHSTDGHFTSRFNAIGRESAYRAWCALSPSPAMLFCAGPTLLYAARRID